ncbi:MAG: arginine N-succinyltransferase [Maricaulaceae bacterium]
MDIFRVARPSDIDAILKISSEAGRGLSTVPKTLKDVENYVSSTAQFIAGKRDANSVLFVLESDGDILGMSGIIVKTDAVSPFWSFEHKKAEPSRMGMSSRSKNEVLQLSSKFNGYSEVGTLLLSKKSRGRGLGKLLSLGRLAFINSHKSSFNEMLMADIRGWQDEDGISPFWTGLSSKFLDGTFDEAERSLSRDKEFLSNSMPLEPLYFPLLEKQVLSCIGRANVRSVGAVKLLSAAGFSATNFCNVLDGGPALECHVNDTIVAKTETIAHSFSENVTSEHALQYNGTAYDFRATIAEADIENATLSERAKLNFPDFKNSPIKLSRLSMPTQFQQVKLKQKVIR